MFVLECVACFVSLMVFVAAVMWYIQGSRYRQLGSKIPGPPGVPLLGNIPSFIARRRDMIDYCRELRGSYGTVCKGWAGPHLVVGLSDPRDVAIVLNSSKTLSKAPIYNPLRLAFGGALVSAETEVWKKFRKIMDPTFAHQIIDTYVSTFYEKSLVMADRLQKHCDEQPFDTADYLMACSLEMVSETSIGVPIDIQKGNRYHCAVMNFPRIVKIVSYFMLHPWFWCAHLVKFSRLYRTLSQLVKPVREFVDVTVKQKTESYHRSRKEIDIYDVNGEGNNNCPKQRLGFLEHMVSTLANNSGLFTLEELTDQTMFVIAAATDTSAFTVAYTLMLLGLHQDVQRKVMKEQEDIFGEDTTRPITARDLKQMVYLEQVINETMRLYPVIPFVARWVDEDIRISDYILPAGTTVIISIIFVHRQAAYYPEPDKFDPERFNKDNSASRPLCSFIPFASGRRMCIGKNYAYMSMKTMLSVILRKYEVLEYGLRDDMESLQYQFLLKMVNGHKIKLRERKKLST